MSRIRPAPVLVLGIVAFCGGLATMVWLRHRHDLAVATREFRWESHDQAVQVAAAIERKVQQIYYGLRTMARLPGVRAIDRHGRGFEGDARQSVQELYNNIAADVDLSEVYIVPPDFDPDAPDPVTGALQVPITTFDELIVGRTGDQAASPANPEGAEVEEIEIFEYRLMRQQLAWFREHVPRAEHIRGLALPAITGPEVVTCDNRRYRPSAPDDADRSGLVLSVPFYDPSGRLGGLVSGVLLTHVLRDGLPDGRFALRNESTGYLATSHASGVVMTSAAFVRQGLPDPSLIYSEVLPVSLVDAAGAWTLWAGRPDAQFWDRSDVKAAAQSATTAYEVVALLGILLLLVRHTITRRRRTEAIYRAQLEGALASAEAAVQAKSVFLATMSHELRTPLNGVFGMTELALDAESDTERRECLAHVRACAESLLSIVSNVLDFSSAEAGKLELADVAFSIEQLVEGVLDTVALEAYAKRLELMIAMGPGVPRRLRGDPDRVRQILLNLVTNAVKFTESGEVVVHVDVETPSPGAGDTSGTVLRLSVHDTGIGIPVSQQAAIFEVFTQVDGTDSRRYAGTGLGLAITRQLVRLMGGEITVASELGHGSTFTCRLRLRAADLSEAEAPPTFIGVRALVVDDNTTSRMLLLRLLEGWGMQVAVARGGDEGVDLASAAARDGSPFHLVVLDQEMPGTDGLLTARRLRQQMATAAIPAVLLAPVTRVGTRNPGVTFAAVLTKPVKSSQLARAVAAALDMAGMPATPSAGASATVSGSGAR